MKKKWTQKINRGLALIMIGLLFLQFFPLSALGQDHGDEKIETGSELQTLESAELPPAELPLEETPETAPEIPETSETPEVSAEDQLDPPAEGQLNPHDDEENFQEDYSDAVVIDSWDIKDAAGNPLSLTNKAVALEYYDFAFSWQLDIGGKTFQAGDHFVLELPQNEGNASEAGWGVWQAPNSSWVGFSIEGAQGDVGRWQVNAIDDKNIIRVEFTQAIEGQDVSVAKGRFELPEKSLQNNTLKGGIQKVVFGKLEKEIEFEKFALLLSSGWDTKNGYSSSNNTMHFGISVNASGMNELSGDVVDWDKNPQTGFSENPASLPNNWGEGYSTDKLNDGAMYVEDSFPAGVSLNGLYISSVTKVPMGLSKASQETQNGGLPSYIAGHDAYLVMERDGIPIYREDGGATGTEHTIQAPTKANAFKRLTQTPQETRAAFKARVKSAPQQYGVYVEGTGTTASRTLMVNFGRLGVNGQQLRYSDMTDQPFGQSDRVIYRVEDTAKAHPIRIPDFAVESANTAIKNDFYKEADREVLEDYFTLTYGDSNVIKGQIASYSIEVHLNFSPLTPLTRFDNVAKYEGSTAVNGTKTGTYETTASLELKNPFTSIEVDKDAAVLLKFDQESNDLLNNAGFQLQSMIDGSWTYMTKDNTSKWVPSVKEEAQIIYTAPKSLDNHVFDGVLMVNGLPNGTYRFVEADPPPHYDPEKSESWSTEAGAVVSESFTSPSAADTNNVLFVRNKKMPRYKVEHYKQPAEGETDLSKYIFTESESLYDKAESVVTGAEKTYIGFSLNKEKSAPTMTGTVREDETLVLKLYYDIDRENVPFTIYKTDFEGKPMPSVGNKTVEFEVYRYIANDWDNISPFSNPPKTSAAGIWSLIGTYQTDDKGRLQVPEITERGDYALVETKTYDDFALPDYTKSYWYFYFDENLKITNGVFLTTDGTSSSWDRQDYYVGPWTDGSEVHNQDEEPTIRNFQQVGFTVYKENFDGTPMPSDKEQQVTFDIYFYTGNWQPGKEPHNNHPKSSDESVWKLVKAGVNTDGQGMISLPDAEKGAYAFVETKTHDGYLLPDDRQFWYFTLGPGGKLLEGFFFTIGEDDTSWDDKVYVKKEDDKIVMKNAPLTIEKTDFDYNKMPSAGDQAVVFEAYRLKGDGKDPLAHHPRSHPDIWEKIKDHAEVDSAGNLSLGQMRNGESYALVEVATHDDFVLPDPDKNYWYFKVSEARNVQARPESAAFITMDDQGNVENKDDTLHVTSKPGLLTLRNAPENEGFVVYKEDFDGNRLVSTADDKVIFEVYEGNWQGQTTHPRSEAGKALWTHIGNYETGVNGSVRLDAKPGISYAFVEIETLEGCSILDPDQYFWYFTTNGLGAVNDGTHQPNWDRNVYYKGPYGVWDNQTQTTEYFDQDTPPVMRNLSANRLYKVDETGAAMPSDDQKKVTFSLYQYRGGWGENAGPEHESSKDLTNTANWTKLGDYDSKENGFLLGLTSYANNTYAIQETSTYPGYKIEKDAYWVIYTDDGQYVEGTPDYWNIKQHKMSWINYVGKEVPRKPIWDGFSFGDGGKDQSRAYIQNQPDYTSFDFTKVDDKKHPLENVPFELYKGKDGAELILEGDGANADPDTPDTYWDMSKPYMTAQSLTGDQAGQVSFKDLRMGNYLLTEKEAPAGFQTPEGKWILQIDPTAADAADRIKITALGSPPAFFHEAGRLLLPNYKVFSLPYAGGFARMAMLAVSIVLLGIAVLSYFWKDGKKAEELER